MWAWWLEQKHIPPINNLTAHSKSLKVYELLFPIKKMNGIYFKNPIVVLY